MLTDICHILVGVSELTCPMPPSLSSAERVSWVVLADGSEHASFECVTGHQFSDASTLMTHRCLTSTWQPNFEDCSRTQPLYLQIVLLHHLILTVDLFPATNCAIPSIPHVTADKSDVVFGDDVIFSCDFGFTFPDGTRRRSSQCLEDSHWSNEIPPCIGEPSTFGKKLIYML